MHTNSKIALRRPPLLHTHRRLNYLSKQSVRPFNSSANNIVTVTTENPNVVTIKYNRNNDNVLSSSPLSTTLSVGTTIIPIVKHTLQPLHNNGNKFKSYKPLGLTSARTTTIQPYRSKKLQSRRGTTESTFVEQDTEEATESQHSNNLVQRSNINAAADQIAKSSISTNRIKTINYITTNKKELTNENGHFQETSESIFAEHKNPSQIVQRVTEKSEINTTLNKKRNQKPFDYYDYYDDNNDSHINRQHKGELKVILHSRGVIECLDQGNFPHPLSCFKFISCAKFETGDVVGWEYTCPTGLSFDPVGGMCNWSGGCNL